MMQDLEPFYLSDDDEVCFDGDTGGESELVRGTLRRSNTGCGWQLDGVDLIRYLAPYRGHELLFAITLVQPASGADSDLHVCDTCGFPLDEMGECSHCQWHSVTRAKQRVENLFQEINRIVEQSWIDPYT